MHVSCFISRIMWFSRANALIIWVLNLFKNIISNAKFISIESTFDRRVFESKSNYFVLYNAIKYRKQFFYAIIYIFKLFVLIFNTKYSISLLNNITSFWNFKLSTNTSNFLKNVVFTIILFENDVKNFFCNIVTSLTML